MQVARITSAQTALTRTPGKDPASYITALIRSVQEWLRTYAKPRPAGDQFIRSDEDNSPAAHIELLEKLLSVLDVLIPDPEISPPTLWHPGLYKPDIFISPTAPHEILGVTGWQTATTGPRYLQTEFPRAMRYTGGRFKVTAGPKIPPLPEGFEELGVEEQTILRKHHWEAVVQQHHMTLIKKDVRYPTGLAHPYAPLFIEPILLVPRTWENGIIYLKSSLVFIQLNWDILSDPGVPCPLTFSPEEITLTLEDTWRRESYNTRVGSLSRELGVDLGGTVGEVEKFELVKRKSDEFRDKWDAAAEGGPYPFQDGGRSLMTWGTTGWSSSMDV